MEAEAGEERERSTSSLRASFLFAEVTRQHHTIISGITVPDNGGE